MLYVDTSVALAHLLSETRRPPESLWSEALVSSRLLAHETWVNGHARGLGSSHGPGVRDLLSHLSFLELTPAVLDRAHEPFPTPVRALDALHLASIEHLRDAGQDMTLAAYDARLAAAARALGIPVVEP